MSESIPKPRQFRLITLIGVVTLAAIVVRLFLAFPSQVLSLLVFAATATAMLWLVSVFSNAMAAVGRFALRTAAMPAVRGSDREMSPWHSRLWIALRYGDPRLVYAVPPAWIVSVATMLVTLLAWRPIRLLGQFFSGLPAFYGTESYLSYVWGNWSWSEWTDPLGWKLNLIWEAGSLAHWWLHFAILGTIGTAVIAMRGGGWCIRERIGRFLWFAPWLMLLDVMLLFSSWMLQPTTVPEPSTGFVVGIFRWELWRWDCWQDQFWLQRASFPCALVTAVFFRRFFDLRWSLAILAGVLSIPMAIMGCIAWSVLFGDVMEWIGW